MKYFRLFAFILVSSFVFSCTKVTESVMTAENEGEILIRASFAGNSTKTVLAEDEKTVLWSPNDAITVFYGSTTGGRFVSQTGVLDTTTIFKGSFDTAIGDLDLAHPSRKFFGLYPYDDAATCDGESITTTVRASQYGLPETFAQGMFPSASVSETLSLPFWNICGGIRFTLSRTDITKISLKSNGGESLAGKICVKFNSYGIPSAEVLEGVSEVTMVPMSGDTFLAGRPYYITLLPGTLSGGFTMTFSTSDSQQGEWNAANAVTVKRSSFGALDNVDGKVAKWEQGVPQWGELRTGLYLGVLGFNQSLYPYQTSFLTNSRAEGAKAFIDGLTSKNGTLLYYAVDNGITSLKSAPLPSDINSVSMVTFTDGLDQGSVMMNPEYPDDETYLDAMNQRILNEKIMSTSITAYSVGFKGTDVTDVDKFRLNLKKLASSEDNVYELSNMSQLSSKLSEIATRIAAGAKQTISLTIPGQANGTKIRFTFDGVSDAAASTAYIEGVFNLSKRTFTDVTYNGMSCSSGTTIQGTVDGIFVTFTFEHLGIDSGAAISASSIAHWNYITSTSKWQKNSEFSPSDIKIQRKSSAVLLILDCSSSLGSQFSTMQTGAKNFVSNLYESMRDKSSVEEIVMAESKTIYADETATLSATIVPDTAPDKTLIWSSSDSRIATVSSDGTVSGISAGECIITATAINGVKANCKIKVIEMPAVDLGLSVKWAAYNIGSYSQEEYGTYFAWGDVVGQTWSGSSWSGGGFSTYLSYELDANNNLKPEYDAAHVNLGGSWRMPTKAELEELISNCTCTWTSDYEGTGVAGRIFTSKKEGYTDKSIFLPAAGDGYYSNRDYTGSEGYYCSSSIYSAYTNYAWYLTFSSSIVATFASYGLRYGQSVRPVTE